MLIDAARLDYAGLNRAIRSSDTDCRVLPCLGQRFIGAGLDCKEIAIEGVPVNALGAYLNGAQIAVHGNAQNTVGDTMNKGQIVIHGTVGYAMRGGEIFVRDNAGYRTGIHTKA